MAGTPIEYIDMPSFRTVRVGPGSVRLSTRVSPPTPELWCTAQEAQELEKKRENRKPLQRRACRLPSARLNYLALCCFTSAENNTMQTSCRSGSHGV